MSIHIRSIKLNFYSAVTNKDNFACPLLTVIATSFFIKLHRNLPNSPPPFKLIGPKSVPDPN